MGDVVDCIKKKGKQKIEYDKPIQSKTKRQVTFTKRRKGLFKKASELSVMCGAQVVVLTFSSAGKLFPFGHPSPDAVVHRFINDHQISTNDNHHLNPLMFDESNNDREVKFGTFTSDHKEVLTQIDAEKAAPCGGSRNNDHERGFWWEQPIEGLGLVELERFKTALEGLRNQVAFKIDYHMVNNNYLQHGTSMSNSVDTRTPQGFEVGFVDGVNKTNCVGDQITSFGEDSLNNNNNGCTSTTEYGFTGGDSLLDLLLN